MVHRTTLPLARRKQRTNGENEPPKAILQVRSDSILSGFTEACGRLIRRTSSLRRAAQTATWKSVYSSDLSFDVWAAVSPGGGLGFGRAVRLNSQRSKEGTCGLGGSEGQAYACDELSWMVMDGMHLDATWGDNRNGQNPWFGRYDFAADPQFPSRVGRLGHPRRIRARRH
jgi:hypothetical protein